MTEPLLPALPKELTALFPKSRLRDALRFLEKGHIEGMAFHEHSLAGYAVTPNKRRLFCAVRSSSATGPYFGNCACTLNPKPPDFCYHQAALVLTAVEGCNPPALPGVRFTASIWYRLAEELFLVHKDRFATAATARGTDVRDSEGVLLVSARGFKELALTSIERQLMHLQPANANLKNYDLSQRSLFYQSPIYAAAMRAFSEFGFGKETPHLRIEDARLYLCAKQISILVPASLLAPFLQTHAPLFEAAGIRTEETSATPSLEFRLDEEHNLHLVPVCLIHDRIVRTSSADVIRTGRIVFLPKEKLILRLSSAKRPFADPETSAQAELNFDNSYRPSSFGVALDRETLVPADALTGFLSRHRDEIASWPEALVPLELRSGGLTEPEGAEIEAVTSQGERLTLNLHYRFNGQNIPFHVILRSRKKRQPIVFARGVMIDPRHPRFAWMDRLEDDSVLEEGDSLLLVLSPLSVCRLRSYLPASQTLTGAVTAAREALERLSSLSPDEPPPDPTEFGITLYDFQKTGLEWLWFLFRNGFGGLLCDDMGLGKTYQAIALIGAAAREQGQPPRTLIVCPASVLPHWDETLRRVLPGCPIRIYTGSSRSVSETDRILITTYGVLRNDSERIGDEPIDLFILDEIQNIKNRGSATHHALTRLRPRVAIGLTGTPIENSVDELRNLIDFVLPGYLPGEAEFRKHLARPIENGDPIARDRMRRLVRPFILRRTKEQVLTSLPEKIEDRRTCEMTPGQRLLYEEMLEGRGMSLRESLEEDRTIPYIHIFALLTRLKQICNHPDLACPEGTAPTGAGSGKWDLFNELLEEALASGLKVVVFSQYVRMLEYVGKQLCATGQGFTMMTGRTVDRAAPVRQFRENPDCRVFLASLKAAGVGIDLTPASVVIHYDRWWNKAREDQATDRVHRLGQKRGVQVITLVTRGTVEDRIERLILEKAKLAADILPEDEAGIFKRFTREELLSLLEPPEP